MLTTFQYKTIKLPIFCCFPLKFFGAFHTKIPRFTKVNELFWMISAKIIGKLEKTTDVYRSKTTEKLSKYKP
jgi:hypothetical protein